MTSPIERKDTFVLKKLGILNEENEKLKKENEDLQIKLDNERSRSSLNIKAQATIEELQDKLKDLKLTKTSSDTEAQRLENELKEVKKELATKNDELATAKTELENKQREIQSFKSELEVVTSQQDAELTKQGHMLESREAEFKKQLADKDNELLSVNSQLQQHKYMLSESNNKLARELQTKEVEINQLMSTASSDKSFAQSQHENQLLQKDNEIATLKKQCMQLQQETNSTIKQLNDNLQQANQRIRTVEEVKQNEAQRFTREIGSLKCEVKSYQDQLSKKDNELSQCSVNLQQQSANVIQLQGRFKALRDEKDKAYTEIEDTLSQLDACAQQIKQSKGENARLSQIIAQKDKEIQQLKEREESVQNELSVRAEKIKSHEKTITELRQQNKDQQRQLQDSEAKCERLEGEVNRVNAKRLHGNSRELSVTEVAANITQHTPDKYPRHGNDPEGQRGGPSNRGGVYNTPPMNQTPAEYQQQQQQMSPLQGTPNRFGYQSQQLPDMGNRGAYGPIPGHVQSPPPVNQGQPFGERRATQGSQHYQGGPPANQFNQPYQPPPMMNQPAGRYQDHQFNRSFNQIGPLEGSFSAELKSDPCPLCGKKFANEEQLTTHAATCNYDPNNH